ncbi:MAG: hypothetical protein A2Y00_09090 [Omnitrophica WOR_2 bacterium GWF2_43_52]|nr:MAG: hypothetical protein A2062_07105 [Omnitrophica WOR_2 bacterium GWA2_44_7]OGX14568.1 MAG: hypothetical protein A2Y01_07140 [Omnitrophica WOR_2 bacterium GWC2_44_8]OGX21915.1 MAG: hypothetical protein A2Y00_09090 [Omnitrophica WOR_2 bacterium GWF2_43_52]OGX58162.1 MAG: hypothetical protein A2460_05615 [Omnitrophica WOR_2 bacterium RIFOXYC2_FULL_43_9]HAH20077.1 3-deoxy-D-manno-octulosonic acid transferase [Candidatus Omnitrophota bacterium]
MFIFYDLIFILFALCYLPLYIVKRKFHQGFLMRLGFFSDEQKKRLAQAQPIWLHAVSVGEVLASKALLEELHEAYPAKQIVISTVTSTGNKVAQRIAQENDLVFYLPFDISFIVKKTVALINPSLVIIAETEIWPNFIRCLKKRNIPIITVNARISDGSFKGYRLIQFLIKPVMNRITAFCVQTETDSKRLAALGVAGEKIHITGNMKFDTADCADKEKIDTADYAEYRKKLGLGEKEKLFVAGSTHPGEEEIVLGVYKKLLKEFPDLRLLLAPRHPERAKEVENLVFKSNLNPVFISALSRPSSLVHRPSVFILDTIGQLKVFYAASDIVFVGGSLIKKGGQNILEPAALAKPIVCGPNMFNFRDIIALFLKDEACIMIHNEEELFENIADLLRNPKKMAALGARAKGLIAQNQGATMRNMEYIIMPGINK